MTAPSAHRIPAHSDHRIAGLFAAETDVTLDRPAIAGLSRRGATGRLTAAGGDVSGCQDGRHHGTGRDPVAPTTSLLLLETHGVFAPGGNEGTGGGGGLFGYQYF